MSQQTDNNFEHGQDINIPVVFTTGIAFVILSIVAVMYLYGLYLRTETAELERKALTNSSSAFENEKRNQQMELITYGWVDADKGIARIPISDAIKKTAVTLDAIQQSATNVVVENPCEEAGDDDENGGSAAPSNSAVEAWEPGEH